MTAGDLDGETVCLYWVADSYWAIAEYEMDVCAQYVIKAVGSYDACKAAQRLLGES